MKFLDKKWYLEETESREIKFDPVRFKKRYYDEMDYYFKKVKLAHEAEDKLSVNYYEGMMEGMRIIRDNIVQTLIIEEVNQ